jgi:cob(I)alamin adenosyltransferase
MSISTRTGDAGTTGLMYNHRVPKTHPRVEACGNLDELNAALGMARAVSTHEFVTGNLLRVQQDLIVLMGEIGTEPEDLPRYQKDGFKRITPESTMKLDEIVREVESQKISFKGWATPGANLSAATLDVARTVCRRAERSVCRLQAGGQFASQEVIVYLNRLSDALWLLARWVETQISSSHLHS